MDIQKIKAKFPNEVADFFSPHYQKHNQARLDHLDSLGLELSNKLVLDVGAGVGDHAEWYLNKGCQVHAVEGRDSLCALMKERFEGNSKIQILRYNLDHDNDYSDLAEKYEIVHCYGLLYHLSEPAKGISLLADRGELVVLETCVSHLANEKENLVPEDARKPSQSIEGRGCRPSRSWVFNRLKERFDYVYTTKTQPNHPEFPLDWTEQGKHGRSLRRAIFVASRKPLTGENLTEHLPDTQERYQLLQ